jgi:hypothetical protein
MSVMNGWAEMLLAVQSFFGEAGERLLHKQGLYPARPELAGDLIRWLYVQAVLLTRGPDPVPWVWLLYTVAASGPAAERELLRRLRAVRGGEVPRIAGAQPALMADDRDARGYAASFSEVRLPRSNASATKLSKR